MRRTTDGESVTLAAVRQVLGILAATFSPLRSGNLRLYLAGQAVSLIGTWMQMTAQSWVVWDLSRSPAVLGTVGMLGALPFLVLGPWTGVWADRLDRRRLLIMTQAVLMALAFLLAILVQTGQVRLWHVFAVAVASGAVSALDMPAAQAFIGDLAGLDQVRRAVVLNAMIVQVSRILGPALAGWLIGRLGAATGFWLNGLSFLAVMASLAAVRAQPQRRPRGGKPLAEFRDGFRFIAAQPRIQDLLIFTALVTFFGFSSFQLFPVFATDVLHRGPETLGLLMGASGAGALLSVLLGVPLFQRVRRTGAMLAAVVAWGGLSLLAFARSTWLPLSVLTVFLTGFVPPVVFTTANGLLQTLAPPHMRARLLSAWMLVGFGLQPLAALGVGAVAERLGAPVAVLLNGALMVAGAALLLALRPALRTWEAAGPAPSGGGPAPAQQWEATT